MQIAKDECNKKKSSSGGTLTNNCTWIYPSFGSLGVNVVDESRALVIFLELRWWGFLFGIGIGNRYELIESGLLLSLLKNPSLSLYVTGRLANHVDFSSSCFPVKSLKIAYINCWEIEFEFANWKEAIYLFPYLIVHYLVRIIGCHSIIRIHLVEPRERFYLKMKMARSHTPKIK